MSRGADFVDDPEQFWLIAERHGEDVALAMVDRLLLTHPDDPKLMARRAMLLAARNRSGEAEQLVADLIARHPDVAEVHSAGGLVSLHRKDFASAVARLQRALALDPANVSASVNLASAYEAQNDAATAVAVLEAALQSHPDDERVLDRRARVATALGDVRGATRWRWAALQAAPTPRRFESWLRSAAAMHVAARVLYGLRNWWMYVGVFFVLAALNHDYSGAPRDVDDTPESWPVPMQFVIVAVTIVTAAGALAVVIGNASLFGSRRLRNAVHWPKFGYALAVLIAQVLLLAI